MFVKYWTSRFPRLLSHSYHALQSCSDEPIFSVYYPTNYAFSKPSYFYEDTEDFKPFDTGPKLLKCTSSPKRQYNNPDYRYKPMNYPNFVMTRKPAQKPQNNGATNPVDGTYVRTNKKGSYNFQRNWLSDRMNYTKDPNDNSRFDIDNPILRDNNEAVREENNMTYGDENDAVRRRISENSDTEPFFGDFDHGLRRSSINEKKPLLNVENEQKEENLKPSGSEKKTEKMDRKNQQQKHDKQSTKHSKKAKHSEPHSSGSSSKEYEMDEDGFTKVKYKGHHINPKKQKGAEHQNENVKWIMPGRENK